VIPKGAKNRHLKEPPRRKAANLKSKSTKEAAKKTRKIGYPPDLKTRPLFPLGWVFSAIFLLA